MDSRNGPPAGVDVSASTVALADDTPRAGPRDLQEGQLFAGRFTIERLLGRGGMGTVYRARDRLVDERVALKVLGFDSAPDLSSLEAFRREVRIARRITHPNVVRIHDLEQHDGRLFISMEFVEGSDLRRELERDGGRFTPEKAAKAALFTAEGLAAAHAVGVVHRDLKPENVLCEASTGRLILSDFGIARVTEQLGEGNRTSAVGGVVGTPAYMAPEQVLGEEAGPAADLYALGVMLFDMLAGRAPFVGPTPIIVAVARLSQPAPDVRTLAAVPEPLAALVQHCLATSARERPKDVAEVIDRLTAFVGEDLDRSSGFDGGFARATARTLRTGRVGRTTAVPLATGRMSLACLPFSFRGPAEHDYLGEALSGELCDVLSRTKGLRVVASGATAKSVGDRDPRRIAQELDVDFVVDGAVQVAGPKLRISVRLVDAEGTQRFADKFDLGLEDVFEVQDQAGRRIAEALRLELTARSAHGAVPEQAIELYLRARRIIRAQQWLDAHKASEMLERALGIAPDFGPALAALAAANVAVWFYPRGAPERDWEAAAEQAVRRAQELAPELVETHVAAARVASHRGQLRETVEALRRALELAPTAAEAHQTLGQLECETGRLDEGIARLTLAHQLEPSSVSLAYESARAAALRGAHDEFARLLPEVQRLSPGILPLHLELRRGAWWGDAEALERVLAGAPALGAPFAALFDVVTRFFLAELRRSAKPDEGPESRADAAPVVAVMGPVIGLVSPRFGTLLRQLLVEIHVVARNPDAAIACLQEAQRAVFYDLAWLERCPLLEPLRTDRRFHEIVREVRAKIDAVWG